MDSERTLKAEANITHYLAGIISAVDFMEIYNGDGDGSVGSDRLTTTGHTIKETSWPREERTEDK